MCLLKSVVENVLPERMRGIFYVLRRTYARDQWGIDTSLQQVLLRRPVAIVVLRILSGDNKRYCQLPFGQ